jgi:16S rRNA (guanine527-N7)-methyltransferase
MEFEGFREQFTLVFEKNGLHEYIKDEIIRKFYALTEKMTETNRVMNITALTTVDKIIPLHYADCVLIEKHIPKNASVIDIGCGGGFPILPLAIVRPDLKITGLDSTEKKIRYVQTTADELGLQVQTIAARAEDVAKLPQYRDSFDMAVSRAVARLNVLDELCLPFVKVGGCLLAMKGSAGLEEADEARGGAAKLNASIENVIEYDLHTCNETEKRIVIEIQKFDRTPKEYPRAFGAIKKKPL